MTNQDFIRIAHRRTVWAEIQRILMDRYISSEHPAREQVICEEVPFYYKEVSQEALLEVLERIEQLQQDERYQMSQFEFRRRDVKPAVGQPQSKEQASPEESNTQGGTVSQQQPVAAREDSHPGESAKPTR